jgi:Uma2 family endonuclease
MCLLLWHYPLPRDEMQAGKELSVVSYQTIETLEEYLMVAQDRVEVTVLRRANNWQPEVFLRLGETVSIASIRLDLPMAAIYEGLRS